MDVPYRVDFTDQSAGVPMSTSHVPGSSLPLHEIEQVEGILLTLRTLDESQHRRRKEQAARAEEVQQRLPSPPCPVHPRLPRSAQAQAGKVLGRMAKKARTFISRPLTRCETAGRQAHRRGGGVR